MPPGLRCSISLLAVSGWLATASLADAAGPADPLLRLVEPGAGATLVVEDFRSRAREVAGSPLFEKLLALPSARAWMASGAYRRAERSILDVEGALGVGFAEIRDELLGDAVVLSLHAGPTGRPDQSRGLLLVSPRNRLLLERLIALVNDAQVRSGELDGADPRMSGGVAYWARLYKKGRKPPEFYTILDDGTFAWSNSEATILDVIDRKASGRPGLVDRPEFRKVQGGLPDRPLASLYVNARFLQAAMAASPRPADDRLGTLLDRYVRAVGMVGVGLEWREGVFVRSFETVDPGKLDPWLRDWLTGPASPAVLPAAVSPATVALASANLNFRALVEAYRATTPEEERPTLENLNVALRGLFLGRDPLTEVLPRFQPGAVLAVEIEPDRAIGRRFPLVAAVGWTVAPGLDDLAGPIDNAIRTVLALRTLGSTRLIDRLRLESRSIGQAKLTVLTDGLRPRLAFRVESDRVVVGNSPEAVGRFGTGNPPSAILEVRDRWFPQAETFAIIDLVRLVTEVRAIQGPLARKLADRSKRPVAEVDRDLRQLIAVADLFKAATFTSTTPNDASVVRRSLGLIAR